jgi:hypothetical protein
VTLDASPVGDPADSRVPGRRRLPEIATADTSVQLEVVGGREL